MKKTLIVSILFLIAIAVHSQTIYSKAFGNPNNQAVIFLHGGPGFNSTGFEATTAQKLAENEFYVIVYDRRGEGRSLDENAVFNFNETLNDLTALYEKHHLKKATLIGHSFGGIVATLYAEKYPDKTESIILVGAPVSLQETFRTILASSKQLYISKKDSVNIGYIRLIENMDTASMQYASYSFSHAMLNNFYSPKTPTEEALKIYSTFRTDSLLIKYGSQLSHQAPLGFLKNENYTSIDLSDNINNVLEKKVLIFGLYGKDDGLYSSNQIIALENKIGKNNLMYLDNCSHNVFIDQQKQFINALKTWLK